MRPFGMYPLFIHAANGCRLLFRFQKQPALYGRNTSNGHGQRYPHQCQIAQKFAQNQKAQALPPIQPQPAGSKRQRVAQQRQPRQQQYGCAPQRRQYCTVFSEKRWRIFSGSSLPSPYESMPPKLLPSVATASACHANAGLRHNTATKTASEVPGSSVADVKAETKSADKDTVSPISTAVAPYRPKHPNLPCRLPLPSMRGGRRLRLCPSVSGKRFRCRPPCVRECALEAACACRDAAWCL